MSQSILIDLKLNQGWFSLPHESPMCSFILSDVMFIISLQDDMTGENHQMPCNSTANTRVRRSMNHRPKRKQRSQIEASSDECSDCEIMITSV